MKASIEDVARQAGVSTATVSRTFTTPDRVRETLFNWLGQDLTGWNCLDLFAGSGALGFEAASRGAARSVLVERSPKAFAALKDNAALLQGENLQIIREDALKFVASTELRFDLVFLDPPYADTAERTDNLYANDSLTVAHDVREWAIKAARNPKWRIVLAGFDGEHDELHERHGWRVVEWYRAGFLKGGMGNTAGTDEDGTVGHVQHKERLWLSPGCLTAEVEKPARQADLFGGAA